MFNKKLVLYLLFLLSALSLGGCAMLPKSGPISIDDLSFYEQMAPYSKQVSFYINWTNTTKGKEIDSLELTISAFDENGNPVSVIHNQNNVEVIYRINEDNSVSYRNSCHLNTFLLDEYFLYNSYDYHENTAFPSIYYVTVNKIYYSDGTLWSMNDNVTSHIEVTLNGKKGTGSFPVSLNFAKVYTSWTNEGVCCFMNWSNTSKHSILISAICQITAITDDNEISKEWDLLADNREFGLIPLNDDTSHIQFGDRFSDDVKSYNIRISRVVDNTGTVWDNLDTNKSLTCIKDENTSFDNSNYINSIKSSLLSGRWEIDNEYTSNANGKYIRDIIGTGFIYGSEMTFNPKITSFEYWYAIGAGTSKGGTFSTVEHSIYYSMEESAQTGEPETGTLNVIKSKTGKIYIVMDIDYGDGYALYWSKLTMFSSLTRFFHDIFSQNRGL